MKLPASLNGRLLALVLGLVVGVWGVTAAVTWVDTRHELDELLDSHLAQAAAILVVQQTGELEGDEHSVDTPTLHRYASKVAFQVFHEGRLVMRSANAPAAPMVAFEGRKEAGFQTIEIDGTAWRVFSTYGAERDVQVFVGEQWRSRSAILWAVLRGTLGPLLLALPWLALGCWWAVRQGVAPLQRLARALGERNPQALHPVIVPGAPSEMAPMLDALNGLFDRIARLMASERRFTADAAHELRTPVAGIRAQAEVALGETNDAARRHALMAAVQGCDRAARVIEQLLTLSEIEAGAAPALRPVDLAEVVRGVVADLAQQAFDKHQAIEVEGVDPALVQGDATLLAVLVRNLVDNAIRYSPAQAAVQVRVHREADRILLQVDDSGPGVGEADRLRMGERFFRVLGCANERGSGLGWSIVRRVAAVHHAQVHVGQSKVLGGLGVQVQWPASAA